MDLFLILCFKLRLRRTSRATNNAACLTSVGSFDGKIVPDRKRINIGLVNAPLLFHELGLSLTLPTCSRFNTQLHSPETQKKVRDMIDDQALGFIANFLGIFIFALAVRRVEVCEHRVEATYTLASP
ncbi:hypothetical protein CR513_55007, partial [Mucuna pruriens]